MEGKTNQRNHRISGRTEPTPTTKKGISGVHPKHVKRKETSFQKNARDRLDPRRERGCRHQHCQEVGGGKGAQKNHEKKKKEARRLEGGGAPSVKKPSFIARAAHGVHAERKKEKVYTIKDGGVIGARRPRSGGEGSRSGDGPKGWDSTIGAG